MTYFPPAPRFPLLTTKLPPFLLFFFPLFIQSFLPYCFLFLKIFCVFAYPGNTLNLPRSSYMTSQNYSPPSCIFPPTDSSKFQFSPFLNAANSRWLLFFLGCFSVASAITLRLISKSFFRVFPLFFAPFQLVPPFVS